MAQSMLFVLSSKIGLKVESKKSRNEGGADKAQWKLVRYTIQGSVMCQSRLKQ